MSAITNKDRIAENNDKINRLIELTKQKGLTSNPKPATTETEMDAMITDKNIGKVVKYVGESGGKYEKDALYIIAEGDGTDSGLFARRLNITEGTLSITENGTYDVMDKASVDVNVANKLALRVGEQSADNPYDITANDIKGITGIGDLAFREKRGLRIIELPETCTSIGSYAFSICRALTSVSMPNVTSIGNYAFSVCTALTSVSMPNATSIGKYAFEYCYALTSLTIPSTCTSIGDSALITGTRTTFFFESTTPPSIQSKTFNASSINKIIVPKGYGETYKTATNWSSFANYIEEATE